MTEETKTCSIRLTNDQIKKIDTLAYEKGLSRGTYLRKIITDHINNYYEDVNIISEIIANNTEQIKTIDNNINLLTQLLYNWLASWYSSHPQLEKNEESKKIVENGINRRDKFMQFFIAELYEHNTNLFSKLTAKTNEEKNE